MHSTKLPGFTAELSIYKTNSNYQMTEVSISIANAYKYNVVPQARMTANNVMEGLYLEYLCARFGGGMSSNADGSTSCNF